MNILVTGGAGFIGSHVADSYIEKGHNVVIIDNLSTGKKEYLNPNAKFYKVDIQDLEIDKIIRDNNIELINHHAAQINLRKSIEEPSEDIDINIKGSVNLFRSAVKNKVKKIIFASTGGAVYGNDENLPAKETDPTNPISPYGINKLAVEKYLHYYRAVYGLEYIGLRYANAYGPRQSSEGESGVISIFIDKLLKNQQPVINGDGNQTRDYVFINDIVKANLLALNQTKHQIYNIGTSQETTVNFIFKKLNELTCAGFKEQHNPPKKGEQMRSSLNCDRIKNELGWVPEYDISKGLQLTFDYFKIGS